MRACPGGEGGGHRRDQRLLYRQASSARADCLAGPASISCRPPSSCCRRASWSRIRWRAIQARSIFGSRRLTMATGQAAFRVPIGIPYSDKLAEKTDQAASEIAAGRPAGRPRRRFRHRRRRPHRRRAEHTSRRNAVIETVGRRSLDGRCIRWPAPQRRRRRIVYAAPAAAHAAQGPARAISKVPALERWKNRPARRPRRGPPPKGPAAPSITEY